MKYSFEEILNYRKNEKVVWASDKPVAGNRTGYKVFSINTTVRNPNRNYDFLKTFEKYNGQDNNQNMIMNYYFDLIKNGIYQSINVPQSVKTAWDNDKILTNNEVKTIIDNNPQATGIKGRVMTQLRALKDQSLLQFAETSNYGILNISITEFGKELLKNPSKAESIYSKIMLSMHAKSPARETIFNQSVPFLNTLFAIKSVNDKWESLGNVPKGIMNHELAIFILSMKDCDYEYSSNLIVEYRKKFGFKIDKDFITRYMILNDILPISWNSLLKDYPDDVFRKFALTGLVSIHGSHGKKYINFSTYNLSKVNYILSTFNNFSFHTFRSLTDYYNYQYNINLPWETSDLIRRKIVESKAKILKMNLDDSQSIEDNEKLLDSLFFSNSLQKAVDGISFDIIIKELNILSGVVVAKSTFSDLPESLRLEYLFALLLGKQYGVNGVVSNLIYNENGYPIHCAGGNKCDLSFHHKDGSYIFELTMLKSKEQILNYETTNIVRHAKAEESKYRISHRVVMVAPRIHVDIARYFKFEIVSDEAKIIPLTIYKTGIMIKNCETVNALNRQFDLYIDDLIKEKPELFVDKVNVI